MEIKEFKRGIDCLITSASGLYEDREQLLDFLHKYLNNDFHKQFHYHNYYIRTKEAMDEYKYLCEKCNLYIYIQKRNEELILEHLQRIKKPAHQNT